jgi:hypothetical protein
MANGTSVAGTWAYRSYINTSDQPVFGAGLSTFQNPTATTLKGTFDMGSDLVLDLKAPSRQLMVTARRPSISGDSVGRIPAPTAWNSTITASMHFIGRPMSIRFNRWSDRSCVPSRMTAALPASRHPSSRSDNPDGFLARRSCLRDGGVDRRRGFFFAPTRSIYLIERAGRPPFSAISRSCSMMRPGAGSSPSRPPRRSHGARGAWCALNRPHRRRCRRQDFIGVVSRVENIIRTQKFEGPSAELLNRNIIARDLGPADKQELS